MYTHPLLELLKSFSKKEMMHFGKFLQSPYFNKRERIIRLFSILKRFHPDFEDKNFTKNKLYTLIFGKSPYNDSTLRNLISDLLLLAQEYLKQEGMKKKPIDSSFYLTKELHDRSQFSLFKNQMLQNKNILEKNNQTDGDYFYNMSRIETDSFYTNLLNQKVKNKAFAETESQKLINGIIFGLKYFILESVKHNYNLLNYSRTYNVKKNINAVAEFAEIFNFDKLISYVRSNTTHNVPIIEIYHNLLKTFLNFDNDSYYKELKKSVIHYSKQIGISENNFLYARLIDYCVRKKVLGSDTSLDIDKELFIIHDDYVQNEYYKTDSNDYLPFDLYRNVLMICITLKKLSYMQNFIITYSKKLVPHIIANAENYSYALLYFEKGMFSKALTYVNKTKFDQVQYKLDMKNLQLKIDYELEHFESAISLIDTYKHFLKNNKLVAENRRILHNNFISSTANLIQYRTGSKKVNLSYLVHKVKKSKNTFNKEWLLEKLYEQTDKYKKSKVA